MALSSFSIAVAQVRVVTIPVGTGDSTMIECPNNGDITFIDMGALSSQSASNVGVNREDFVTEVMRHTNNGQRLKHIFLTHPDEDHISFTHPNSGVVTKKQEDEYLLPKLVKTIQANQQNPINIHIGSKKFWKDKRFRKGTDRTLAEKIIDYIAFIENGQQGILKLWDKVSRNNNNYIDICGNNNAVIQIISNGYENHHKHPTNTKNSNSMVLKLITGGSSMLFLGDIENQSNNEHAEDQGTALGELLTQHLQDLKSDIIVFPHHGSSSKGNGEDEFYKAVDAQYGIISSGIAHAYHHPSLETVRAFCQENSIKTCNIDTKSIFIFKGLDDNLHADLNSVKKKGSTKNSVCPAYPIAAWTKKITTFGVANEVHLTECTKNIASPSDTKKIYQTSSYVPTPNGGKYLANYVISTDLQLNGQIRIVKRDLTQIPQNKAKKPLFLL